MSFCTAHLHLIEETVALVEVMKETFIQVDVISYSLVPRK